MSLIYLHPKIGGPPAPPVTRPSPTPRTLAGNYWVTYQFVTPSVGWAVVVGTPMSTQFWIFKTTDGARHWVTQYMGRREANSPLPHQIRFFDRSHGIVIAGPDAVLRTSDGGNHWTKLTLPLNGIISLTFSDPMHGWAGTLPGRPAGAGAVAHFHSTTDGGDTWTQLPPLPPMTGLVFRSPGEGWAGGADPARPTVYSSEDGGATWSAHPLPVRVEPVEGRPWVTMPQVFLIPERGVMAIVQDAVYASFDGGVTWRNLVPPPAVSYYEVAFEDAMHWWAMQQYGALYKTSDAGRSWNRVSSNQPDGFRYVVGIIDSKNVWLQVFIRSLQQGHTTGFAITADGGLHWTYANVPTLP